MMRVVTRSSGKGRGWTNLDWFLALNSGLFLVTFYSQPDKYILRTLVPGLRELINGRF